ncbi:MAG: hypothetical protein U0946_01585 [Patescibacteria group bacterium]|nr:hypothetical protein [Patescibacteria group bacterium]
MSVRILWRSTVFIITLALIYLAFPILIVPSPLPPVQSTSSPDAQIFEVKTTTIDETIQSLRERHRQGMKLILAPFSP